MLLIKEGSIEEKEKAGKRREA